MVVEGSRFALPFDLASRFAFNTLGAEATAVCLVGSSVVGTGMISSPVCSFPIFGLVSLFFF